MTVLPKPHLNNRLLADLVAASGTIPTGKYRVEVLPKAESKVAYSTIADTLHICVQICEGPYTGRQLSLQFKLRGEAKFQGFVERDVRLIAEWCEGIGANPETLDDLPKVLWSHSKNFDIVFEISSDAKSKSGLTFYSVVKIDVHKKDTEKTAPIVSTNELPSEIGGAS